MIYGVYSVRDIKTSFSSPVLYENSEFARRGFLNAIYRDIEEYRRIGVSQADLFLYCIGEFDTEIGLLTPCNPPEYIASGSDLIIEDGDADA